MIFCLNLERYHQEKVCDLRFLDGQREEIDLFQELNLHVFDRVAQLGDGDLLLVLGLASSNYMAVTLIPTLLLKPLWKPPWPLIVGLSCWCYTPFGVFFREEKQNVVL